MAIIFFIIEIEKKFHLFFNFKNINNKDFNHPKISHYILNGQILQERKSYINVMLNKSL